MARDLGAQQGIGNDANFLNGNLVDNQTIVGEGINQDLVQFFQKLMDLSGLNANGNPDNEVNGYQFITALQTVIRSLVSTTDLKGTVEKATTAEAQAGASDKFLDAALLQQVTATETRKGIVEKAIPAEVIAGTADKFIDAALLKEKELGGQKVLLEVGTWNMAATTTHNINYALPTGKALFIYDVIIFPDSGSNQYSLTKVQDGGFINVITSTYINISRLSSGFFDSASYSGSANRGLLIGELFDIP